MAKNESKSNGIGVFGLTFIVFLVLKLAEIGQVATWSWWWVTAPLWMPFILGIAIVGIILIGAVFVAYIDSKVK